MGCGRHGGSLFGPQSVPRVAQTTRRASGAWPTSGTDVGLSAFEWIKLNVKSMADAQVRQLDEFDRLERLAAHRSGYAQPLAVLPARRTDGKVYGHIGG